MKAKKISQLLIGTNNKGKLREIKALLPKNIKIYSTSDYNLKSPKENGKTFRENSLIKASFFSKKSKQICMSDDSGLEINLLNNQPGIYSARWGGKKNNFDLAIKKVFKKLDKQVSNWRNRKINAKKKPKGMGRQFENAKPTFEPKRIYSTKKSTLCNKIWKCK